MDSMNNNENICIAFLIAKLSLKLRNRLNKKLNTYGMTIEQRLIILKLIKHGAMSQRELCEKTLTEASNLTITLKRMEQKGYIRKVKHPVDKRALLIEATPKACSLEKELKEIGRVNTKSLLLGIDEQKINIVKEVLQEMYSKALQEEYDEALKMVTLLDS